MGQTSNSTGKSETADDTASTVYACTYARNHTTRNVNKITWISDPLSKDTDNASDGTKHIDKNDGYLRQQGRARQTSNTNTNSFPHHWQSSQQSLVFDLQPSTSVAGRVGDVCNHISVGATRNGASDLYHQFHLNRETSHQQRNTQSHEICGDGDRLCRQTSKPSVNEDRDTGFKGMNEAQGHSQMDQEHHHAHGFNMCKSSYLQEHSTWLFGTATQESDSDASMCCRPITSFLPTGSWSLNTLTCSDTSNRKSEDMANKSEMDFENANGKFPGTLVLSLSNKIPVHEHIDPIEVGMRSHESMPLEQVRKFNVSYSCCCFPST